MEENTAAAYSVFVIGATEGLGRALTRHLVARGHKVTGVANSLADAQLIRSDGGLPAYNGLFRASEIASALKMAKADVLVNVAPQKINGLPVQSIDWDYYQRLLSAGTAACVQAAADAEVKYLVHCSYAFAYGDTGGEAVDESAHLSHELPLFAAVAEAEAAVLAGDVPACVLRAGYNYGPGSESLQALHRALIDRKSLGLGEGENAAAWIHELDLAEAIALAAEQQPAGAVLNIGAGNALSPLEFASLFAETLGVPPLRPTRVPMSLRQLMGDANAKAILKTSVKLSSAKAQDTLRWTPTYSSIEAGLEQTLLVWRAAQPA